MFLDVVSTYCRGLHSATGAQRPPCDVLRERFCGFVANFVQNVMKGQLPLSVRRLSGESVELFGRSEALVSGLHYHLFFLDHVHEFDPN
jgi:hypothetical protein